MLGQWNDLQLQLLAAAASAQYHKTFAYDKLERWLQQDTFTLLLLLSYFYSLTFTLSLLLSYS